MDILKIQGGHPLRGEVTVSGSKNACLPIFAACLMTDQPCIIKNVPNLSDVNFMAKILAHLGASISQPEPNTWRIHAKNITPHAPYELVRKMRASVCLLGPLVGRLGYAELSMPGGCVIGHRPIDLHLRGLEKLGCTVQIKNGYIIVDTSKGLSGTNIFLGGRYGSTVTGTANILMAAVLTPGITQIDSAACEPEIVDLCNMLVAMGANIQGIGSHTLVIEGVEKLNGCTHTVIGDRIEAGTFIVAGLLNKENNITVSGTNPKYLSSLLHQLEGADITISADNKISIKGSLANLTSRELVTLPYPGFPTDLQAQMLTLLCLTPGISVITERVYPNRFMHVPELQRMGAKISIEGANAIINGVTQLSGAPVMASDLRASAALVLAGLVAQGETTIHRLYHLDRGYENIDAKLRSLGAHLERLSESDLSLEQQAI